MENIACTNSNVNFLTLTASTWNLGTGSSPTTPAGNNVTTVYSNTGRKDIVYSGNSYTGFANIILGNPIIPQAGTTAPLVAGEFRICAGESVDFSALNPGTNYVYQWNMDGGATPNTYSGPAFDVVNGVTFNTPGDYYITLNFITDCCGATTLDSIHLFVDPVPSMTIAGPTAFCADDSAGVNLTASGASTYTWGPATGLSSTTGATVNAYPTTTTTYTVTGVNSIGNCFDDATVTVTVNDLALTPSSTDATCGANGSASVSVTGGSGVYTFDWPATGGTANSITNVPFGNYQVLVSDLFTGCSDSLFIPVNPGPATLTPFVSNVTSTTCNNSSDGAATISLIGGVGPIFLYTWIDTTSGLAVGGNAATNTPLPAGTYAVTIFDIGNPACPGAALVTIPEPTQVVIGPVDTLSPTCDTIPDGTIVGNASGGTGPYVYEWLGQSVTNDSLINVTAGTYTLVATDVNGCDDTLDIVLDGINDPCTLPVEWASFVANPAGDHIQLDWETSAEAGNLGFEVWRSLDGREFQNIGWVDAQANAFGGASYTLPDREVLPNIRYYYQLKQLDQDGSFSYSEIREAMLPGSEQMSIRVYPQPVRDIVQLEFAMLEAGEVSIEVVGMTGQQLGLRQSYETEAGPQKIELDLSELADGMYFGRLVIRGQVAGVVKFVKAN